MIKWKVGVEGLDRRHMQVCGVTDLVKACLGVRCESVMLKLVLPSHTSRRLCTTPCLVRLSAATNKIRFNNPIRTGKSSNNCHLRGDTRIREGKSFVKRFISIT